MTILKKSRYSSYDDVSRMTNTVRVGWILRNAKISIFHDYTAFQVLIVIFEGKVPRKTERIHITGFRSYFKGVLWAHTPRAADFGWRIIDNELFIRNPVVTYVSEITHFLFGKKIHSIRSVITLNLHSPQNEGAKTTTLR